MTILTRSPDNTDFLQRSKYLLTFSRLPTTQYFCQSVNIPGVSVQGIVQSTPFADLYRPGEKIAYDTFDITFYVNEDLISWKGIHDWIKGMTFPETFDEYKNLKNLSPVVAHKKDPQYSDATLTILNNLNNPKLRINLTDVFPISLSSIVFDTQTSADDIITTQASFRFSYYDFTKA